MAGEKVLVLELNEVNFRSVEAYAAQGLLPSFAEFFTNHGFVETTSEQHYEELEPWIQWVTAHTGLSLAEHGVFRLGDIVEADFEQIWERLSAHGISVGAISPMNAKCRGNNWDFFVPDPWTPTGVVADPLHARMYRAIAQAVNDNAQTQISVSSLFHLGMGGIATALPVNYASYANFLLKALGKPWYKAIFLDQLLADLFVRLVEKKQTRFATLFVNAAAHIQHHYMFSSSVYDGEMRNPEWYVAPGTDPLLDVYRAYDRILVGVRRRFPDARIVLATGLHQDPHPKTTYYWRLKNHAEFLTKIGLCFERVEPRMSRDFVVFCHDVRAAAEAAEILESAKADNGQAIFMVDNRGTDLFVMLAYPEDIKRVEHIEIEGRPPLDIRNDVAFVAIKNGRHNGIGYFADSGLSPGVLPPQFPLREMPDRIFDMFGVAIPAGVSMKAAA